MSDQAPDINDPAGGATHDRNADILGKNRSNDLSVYGHFGPRRRGPIAKKDIIYPSELASRHVSGARLFEVQPATSRPPLARIVATIDDTDPRAKFIDAYGAIR